MNLTEEKEKAWAWGVCGVLHYIDPPNEDKGFQQTKINEKASKKLLIVVGCFICSKVQGSSRLAVLRTERKRANNEPRTWHGFHEVQEGPGCHRKLLRVCKAGLAIATD